ncbi:uncharacterized protein PHALS_03718 [Plasmopara halstedii]|uniref:Uncharacterized protein n=1 Tax=Plasmopara halstedii TaxID=4781 RepID=A0A0P1AZK5_PLAHL|nr:uncharacterized protein PHALS_03718 [Plasmopara halstedii]CEG47056.1 hypothetical protein PHALS_03718 [Plasmopara halstedii]|eukprot:XP_024583425.1 hypothetical protein PHALS_03718 [Plasmopara halstedii]
MKVDKFLRIKNTQPCLGVTPQTKVTLFASPPHQAPFFALVRKSTKVSLRGQVLCTRGLGL